LHFGHLPSVDFVFFIGLAVFLFLLPILFSINESF
jgi:hypothetical protein